jgi:hypothetical protein
LVAATDRDSAPRASGCASPDELARRHPRDGLAGDGAAGAPPPSHAAHRTGMHAHCLCASVDAITPSLMNSQNWNLLYESLHHFLHQTTSW